MKEQVENFLRTEKERIMASEKQKRDNLLISIGLVDKEKSSRIYSNVNYETSEYKLYDAEKKAYYKESFAALDVTEEEYLEICKYLPTEKTKVGKRYPALRTIAGIFSGFAWIIGIVTVIIAYLAWDKGGETYGLMVAISTLVVGVLMVLGLLGTAESIKVIIDIEENTRKTGE